MRDNQDLIILLHLDDDIFFLEQMQHSLQADTHSNIQLESFHSIEDFLDRLDQEPKANVCLLDIDLGHQEQNGQKLIKITRKKCEQAAILMCSDLNEPRTVRESFSQGADDFLFKAVDMPSFWQRIEAAHSKKNSQAQATKTQAKLQRPKITSAGKTLSQISERLEHILNSAITAVHITGESGTGKEVVSEILESLLPKGIPFNRIHCGAIAPSLLESELFGHVKGAFTGANQNKIGLIERAHGGWIFLDEVASLSPSAQVALLRVLENQRIRPVGATEEKPVSIRVLSATNESMEELVKNGSFRMDLWQRLCELVIDLPPLRHRMNELEEIVEHFAKNMLHGPYEVPASTLHILSQYDWHKGNIRELRNCLRAMTEQAVHKILSPNTIPETIWNSLFQQDKSSGWLNSDSTSSAPATESSTSITIAWEDATRPTFDYLSMQLLLSLVRQDFRKHGKLSLRNLASSIGITRSTLSAKLHKLTDEGFIKKDDLKKMVNLS